MAKSYTVQPGDTLEKISARTYGTPSRWTEIVKANPQLAGRKTAIDGSPLIFPGDTLILQNDTNVLPPKETVSLDPSAPEDFALVLGGKRYTGFTGYTLVMSMNGVDAFSFSTVWNAQNAELRRAFSPFSFTDCDVYYDGEVAFRGKVLPPSPSVEPDSKTINVQGYPTCGVLIDSCLPESLYPAEYSGLNLKQIAETVCAPFGVSVTVKGDVGAAFDKVDMEVSDKVWDFLQKLAEQRGMILSNTEDGGLLIYTPESPAVSSSFRQGEFPFISCAAELDKQGMYSHITGYSRTTGDNPSQKYTYENKLLINAGVLRCYADVIEDTDEGGLEKAVKSLAAKMFANCIKYKLSVSGHRDKNGKLYKKNMAISVYAPGAEIYRDTKFLVDELTFRRSDSEGARTDFVLVLPESRTGELPEVFPWEE